MIDRIERTLLRLRERRAESRAKLCNSMTESRIQYEFTSRDHLLMALADHILGKETGPTKSCNIASDKTAGAFYCSREPGHDGPCAPHIVNDEASVPTEWTVRREQIFERYSKKWNKEDFENPVMVSHMNTLLAEARAVFDQERHMSDNCSSELVARLLYRLIPEVKATTVATLLQEMSKPSFAITDWELNSACWELTRQLMSIKNKY